MSAFDTMRDALAELETVIRRLEDTIAHERAQYRKLDKENDDLARELEEANARIALLTQQKEVQP